jgi:hypothetical protein
MNNWCICWFFPPTTHRTTWTQETIPQPPNSTVFYSTRTPIPQPMTATKPELHQTNTSQNSRLNQGRPHTEPRTAKKPTSHPTSTCDFSTVNRKNSQFRTDNWGSAALGIYYFTKGDDTKHPHQLCTKDCYHASIPMNNKKTTFILTPAQPTPTSPRSPRCLQTLNNSRFL